MRALFTGDVAPGGQDDFYYRVPPVGWRKTESKAKGPRP